DRQSERNRSSERCRGSTLQSASADLAGTFSVGQRPPNPSRADCHWPGDRGDTRHEQPAPQGSPNLVVSDRLATLTRAEALAPCGCSTRLMAHAHESPVLPTVKRVRMYAPLTSSSSLLLGAVEEGPARNDGN